MSAVTTHERITPLRDVARRYLRKNAFLALRGHASAMPRWAFLSIIGALLALRAHSIVSMIVAWGGWGLDPSVWAGHLAPTDIVTPFHHHPNPFGWRYGFQFFVGAHNVTGALLFLTCLVPLFASKGAKLHVRVGRAFVVVWIAHLVDGLVNSAQILITRGFEPTRYLDVTGQGFSLYLYIQFAFISSMVIDFLAHGLAALHYKSSPPGRVMRAVMLFLPSSSLLFGLGIAMWGAARLLSGRAPETPNTIPFAVVFVVQVPAYLYLILRNISYWLHPTPRQWLHGWVTEHQRNMMFCVQVTLYTGLANLCSRHAPALTPFLFASIDVGFLVWILLRERSMRRAIVGSRLALALVAAERRSIVRSAEKRRLGKGDRAWVARLIDTDDSGTVETSEIARALAAHGIELSPTERERLGARLDRDGSGVIDRDELVEFLEAFFVSEPTPEDELALAFRQLDRDGDGRIDADELRAALRSGDDGLSGDEAEQILVVADLDRDGTLDWHEFVRAMRGEPDTADEPDALATAA